MAAGQTDFRQLLDFYRRQLHDRIMAYWLRQVDWDLGGVLNCLSNRGDRLLADHKFVWSQGRFAWQCARAYEASAGEVPEGTRRMYLDAAALTARFLMRHARLDSGNCAFVLSRGGQPLLLDEAGRRRDPRPGERYDYSIHADNFAAYGVGEYARVAGDGQAWAWARELFASVLARHRDGSARYDFPYPPPAGYRTHSESLGLVEYAGELARAAERFGEADLAAELRAVAAQRARQVLERFAQPDGLVLEMLGADWRPAETLFGRYVNPGHTLESMWFVTHWALAAGERAAVGRAAEVTRATCRAAWDAEFGGLPQFMDREGGAPRGVLPPGEADSVMAGKLRALWDKKLWWPHSEALYALLLAYEQTGGEWALEEYRRVHEYAFRTFPNPDREVGEWIQIRDRQGRPEETVVALPVKDPMHIARAFLHVIQVLKRLAAAAAGGKGAAP